MTSTMAYTATVRLVNVTCWCSIPFAIPQSLYNQAQGPNHTTFYCPAGHSCSYGNNEFDRTKENLAWYEKALTRSQESESATARQLAAQKGVTTKLKKRIAAGVCPCCNRQFQNLHRHMAGQHPDFAGSDV